MTKLRIPCLLLALALFACAAPVPAQADDAGFGKFCRSWMKKLRQREAFNREQAAVEDRGGKFVLEYTGYSLKPVSCTATRGRGKALIGTLIYDEIRYAKTGAKRAAVGKSKAVAVKRSRKRVRLPRGAAIAPH